MQQREQFNVPEWRQRVSFERKTPAKVGELGEQIHVPPVDIHASRFTLGQVLHPKKAEAQPSAMDDFPELRVPPPKPVSEEPKTDAELHRQELQSALKEAKELSKKLTEEIAAMKKDELKDLTWMGKLIVQGVRWMNGGPEKTNSENLLDRLKPLLQEIADCLTLLKDYPKASSTGMPIMVSSDLHKRCQDCLDSLFTIQAYRTIYRDEAE